MKKIFFLLAIYSLFIISCGHKHSHDGHEGHDHSHDHEHTEAGHEGHDHDHSHEGHEHSNEDNHEHEHDHSHEGHDHPNEDDHEHDHDHSHEGHDHSHEDNHEHDHGHADESGLITFTKAQASKIDFAVNNPVLEPLGQVIRTTARITSDQTDESIVVARTAGIVIFAGNTIVEGKNVTAGQVLFSISGSGMADNNVNVRLAEAQSAYTKAEADYNRSLELSKDKIVSDKELRLVKSEYESAKANYDNLYKNFSENGQRVSSSTGGFVKQVYVSNGQYVEAGQALVSVSKNKSLLLKADVPARYASLLPYIASANIRKPNDATVYTLSELNGKILSFGRSVNEDSYLLPVTFQIDNKAGFIPGGFVEVFIKTQSGQPVLSVPKEAITENQGVYYVFVQVSENAYEKREVRIGVNDGLRTEIISGLCTHDKIVSKGAVSVKLAESSGALDPHAGHVH